MRGASCAPSTLQLSPSMPPVGERRDILRPLLEAERAHDEDKVWHSGARVHIRAGNRAVRAPFFSAERLTSVESSGAGQRTRTRAVPFEREVLKCRTIPAQTAANTCDPGKPPLPCTSPRRPFAAGRRRACFRSLSPRAVTVDSRESKSSGSANSSTPKQTKHRLASGDRPAAERAGEPGSSVVGVRRL